MTTYGVSTYGDEDSTFGATTQTDVTTRWRARRQAESVIDTDLRDVAPVKSTVNKFADRAELVFDDPNGNKKADYPRGQRVELEVSEAGSNTFTRRFAGMVQDVTEAAQGEADTLKVSLVGYDLLLRTRTVYKDYSSSSLSTILKDLIQTFTPITYTASNVTFANDKTVDLSFDGARVDTAISRIASESGDEDFGVNDDFEFFFEQRETQRAPSDIVDGDWMAYDLPEEGHRAINRVELFYGASGNRSRVIVEDRAAQRDLKDKLGAAGNVVISEEATYPEISTEDEARSKAREILDGNSQIQTGTVTTFERFGMDAGDVFRLQISEKGIDTDFRIAQIEYHWRRDQTKVTVAENTGDVEDLLSGLVDNVRRIDARDADPDATFTQFLQIESGVTVTPSATVTKQTYGDATFVPGVGGSTTDETGYESSGGELGYANAKSESSVAVNTIAATTATLNQLRDVWQGESPTTVSHLGVGTGTDDAASTDSSLNSPLGRTGAVTQTQPTATSLRYRARVTGAEGIQDGSIAEFGLFDADASGSMYLSAQTDAVTVGRRSEIVINSDLAVDDDSERLGVITTTGQEHLVDLFDGSVTDAPTDMTFGTGTGDAAESDMALESKLTEKALTFADRSRGVSDVEARLSTGEANGNDLSELGEENTNNELLSRVAFEAISKTSDFALDANHIFRARNA